MILGVEGPSSVGTGVAVGNGAEEGTLLGLLDGKLEGTKSNDGLSDGTRPLGFRDGSCDGLDVGPYSQHFCPHQLSLKNSCVSRSRPAQYASAAAHV